eukprot:CAMPEP_0194229388 /NCGR_PEP_ID=MMETSP0156-20130528/43867_1 /TAXON_ID=33649 /ORGANISM="Thalassionema nitzschioides, Strain L26-B" /LENGTH=487 /DNA_ID=CAMNT_0038961937 /DNA_START=89 /DNA_END=1552 /DNA_ORIENTATION=+
MKHRLAVLAACFFIGIHPVSAFQTLKFSRLHGRTIAEQYCRDTKATSWVNGQTKLFALPSNVETNEKQINIFNFLMIGLPVTSFIFPALLQLAKSLTPNSLEQLTVITALFVSNRAYLYALSVTIVGLAALRGSVDSPQLGQRITDLTEELLYRPSLEREERDDKVSTPAVIESLKTSGLKESLDQVSTETQALILPIFVSVLLAISVFSIPFWNELSGVVPNDELTPIFNIQELLSKAIPQISQVWNAFLLALFTRSEVRRLGRELSVVDSAFVEWAVAIVIVSFAFFSQIWTAQNFVNMALAVLVARSIQLGKFPAIVGALSLLTLYDATSVFLIPAANAVDVIARSQDSIMLANASPASSAMGSVAMQKLTSGTFQPGLLVTKIGNQLGGSLGLGDAVFPSLLSTFVRRFDMAQEDEERVSLFAVSIGGYLLGCLACEFAPLISSSGLPALIFIIPFMLGSVLAASSVSGELTSLWQFDPEAEK